MAIKKKSEEKVLEVNAAMQGELTFKDPVSLTINGTFQGKLNTKGTLLIGSNAFVVAEIIGDDITIAGKVEGNVCAENSLKIVPPANVRGEIRTPVLIIEEGAVLNGSCSMKSENSKYLTLDEMARYLKIDNETLLNWAEESKVPVIKEGASFFFDRREVENWLSKEKVS
ncbi:MAG: polymer-forming cytoskeletal protein [Candidatus Omnitrophica bacterium]|nr:polymer-forming cytoskeletal protein [Candidatus Omnitrophota bacterium]